MSSMRIRLEAAKQKSRRGASGGKLLFSTPGMVGGSDKSAALAPCVTGNELVWVKHPEFLCGGRIGTSGKGCLKSLNQCDVEAHERSKCDFPEDPFLIPMAQSSSVKGHSNVLLLTDELEPELITSLLERVHVNWAKEFEVIRSNGTKSIQQAIISKSVVHTARKQTSFETPAKKNAIVDLEDKLHDLKSITDLVEELGDETLNDDGVRANRINLPLVEDEGVLKNIHDLYSQLDILCEHARIVKDVLASNSDLMDDFVKPVQSVLAGVRLEVASVRGDIGSKDLSLSNV